ncbi:UPF0149 family protein [Arenimonas composti]|uniref:YecA family protein n=1 Tax=Arenimonas composti TR7-09 = DSM 18010 TaxID=1121013 RepID=A0A091BXM0_9GAMM|nr:UPF0149 family protein [Arenimonas composti]KFN49095.1 hypothetical protein P873_12440 [Arenimonas composti TR7-09 = DSM 18010]
MRKDWFRAEDDRVDELDRLLEQRAVPFGGFGLEALDGYLSAVLLAPGGDIGFAEWSALIWGKHPPRWESERDEAEATALLMLAHETVARRLRTPPGEHNAEHAVFWWLPDDPEAEQGDELEIGAVWAGGFLEGMALRDEAWDAWIAEEEWIGEIEDHVTALAIGSLPPLEEGAEPVDLSYRERLEIYFSLPDMLHDLHLHRIESLIPRTPVRRAAIPERNDPCPCGSGKKYKKCCGA